MGEIEEKLGLSPQLHIQSLLLSAELLGTVCSIFVKLSHHAGLGDREKRKAGVSRLGEGKRADRMRQEIDGPRAEQLEFVP